MKNKLFMGGLAWGTTESSLREACERFGELEDVKVIMDRETGRSKGFGFVEMGNAQEADKAIAALNGQDNDGRSLKVNEAKPRVERSGGGGGYGGGGGGNRRY